VDGIRISPNGKFLATGLFLAGSSGSIGMWAIGSNGTLTSVPGSPFAGSGAGSVAGIDINGASTLLFASLANSLGSTIVDVFSIASNGGLTQIVGSPFTFNGQNSNVPLLSPNGKFLFVSNQFTDSQVGSITALNVAANGSLSQVSGSPFANPGGFLPSGLGTDAAGKFLFAANFNDTVSVFSVGSNGTLTPAPGSPFSTGVGGFTLLSLAVFSESVSFNTCIRDNVTGDVLAFNSATGAYQYTRCKDGFSLSGAGIVRILSGILTLTLSESNLKISASFNTGQRTGTATIQFEVAQGVWQTDAIHDTTLDGTGCSCGL
jgi:hypothetical protein